MLFFLETLFLCPQCLSAFPWEGTSRCFQITRATFTLLHSVCVCVYARACTCTHACLSIWEIFQRITQNTQITCCSPASWMELEAITNQGHVLRWRLSKRVCWRACPKELPVQVCRRIFTPKGGSSRERKMKISRAGHRKLFGRVIITFSWTPTIQINSLGSNLRSSGENCMKLFFFF